MKTKKWAMVLVFLSTISAASGQILIKEGMNRIDADPFWALIPVGIGYCLYGFAAAILIVSLKYGELSVLYPIYAMNFVWVAMLSPYFFPDDKMNAIKWAGIFSVVAGVGLIGLGSKEVKK